MEQAQASGQESGAEDDDDEPRLPFMGRDTPKHPARGRPLDTDAARILLGELRSVLMGCFWACRLLCTSKLQPCAHSLRAESLAAQLQPVYQQLMPAHQRASTDSIALAAEQGWTRSGQQLTTCGAWRSSASSSWLPTPRL